MIQSNAPRRSRLQILALTAVVGLAVLGLSQCRSVSDAVTGVDLSTPHTLSGRSSCARKCNTEFKAALVAEECRHMAARRACGFSYSCKKDEDRLHAQNLKDLVTAKRHCKQSCYNEGAGNAGA
jgi:hypothetical protein